MIFVFTFLLSLTATLVFLFLIDLRPCDRTYGNLLRCTVRVWVDDTLYRRNLAAVMAEQRIGMSVINPKAFVIGGIS